MTMGRLNIGWKHYDNWKKKSRGVKASRNLLDHLFSKSQEEAVAKAAEKRTGLTTVTFGSQNPGFQAGNINGRGASTVHDIGLSVLYESSDPIADVVFVRGLRGRPRRAWATEEMRVQNHQSQDISNIASSAQGATKDKSRRSLRKIFSRGKSKTKVPQPGLVEQGVYWPLDLLPNDCNNTRIFTWGYDSVVTKFFGGPTNKNNMLAHAKDLLYVLGNKRLDCIVSAAGFSTNDQSIRNLQINSSDLEIIYEEFISLYERPGRHFEVCTFQEAQGLTGVSYVKFDHKVVENSSSALTGTERILTINANHMSMCRFAKRTEDGYQKVVGELQRRLSVIKVGLVIRSTDSENMILPSKKSPSQRTFASSAYSLNVDCATDTHRTGNDLDE
ncbi:hypothetical protein EAF04_001340 [Stromatinia cepivora]|nr:hypothetical protein EAF04_001340 [Stromatinia cepivora]